MMLHGWLLRLCLLAGALVSVQGFVVGGTARWTRGAPRANGSPVSDLSLADLKAELDRRDVKWRGVCFERSELETALLEAGGVKGKKTSGGECPGCHEGAAARS